MNLPSGPEKGCQPDGLAMRSARMPHREAHMSEQKDVEHNCPECDGTGRESGMKPMHLGEKVEFRPCTRCGGSGKIKEAAG